MAAPVSNGTPMIGIMVLAVLVLAVPLLAIVLGMRQEQRKRELEHTERMRALELGRAWPGDGPFWTPGKLAAGMGLLVPVAGMLMAMIVSLSEPELGYNAWGAAALVGLGGVIGATVLTLRHGAGEPDEQLVAAGKPGLHDPDMYDTAGQRGWSGSAPGTATP